MEKSAARIPLNKVEQPLTPSCGFGFQEAVSDQKKKV